MSNVLVSSFELLFARQIAQVPDPGSPVNTVSRRVVQGYFLTLANLEDKAYTYRVELRMTPQEDPAGAPLFVKRIGNVLSAPGIFSSDGDGRYSTRIKLAAHETGLLGVFPPTLLAAIGNPSATEYQSRGYVSISLPALATFTGRFSFSFKAQSKSPVNVLATPDLRGTFLPNNFSAGNVTGDFDFDQTFATLPVASGSSVLSVPPTQPQPLTVAGATGGLAAVGLDKLDGMLGSLSMEEQAALLQALFSSTDGSPETLAWLNASRNQVLADGE
jgi:hypothetical protein